jgi:hypothetical protein
MIASSPDIARSISRKNPGSPSETANSRDKSLIYCTARLMPHLPGLPIAGLLTNDFVSPPANRTSRTESKSTAIIAEPDAVD